MDDAQCESPKASEGNTEKIRQILAGVFDECVMGREVFVDEVWRKLQAGNIPLAEMQDALEDKDLLAGQGVSDKEILETLRRGTGGAEQFKAWFTLKAKLIRKVNRQLFWQSLADPEIWTRIFDENHRYLGL